MVMCKWVFGYGSLIWNPGFRYEQRIVGYVHNYERVFDLACYHRGTKELPARMCDLQHKPGAICWGVAYSICGSDPEQRQTLEYLEKRECEYDSFAHVDFYAVGDSVTPYIQGALIYTSTPCKEINKHYLGASPTEKVAKQIAVATGPCGSNREYLFKLEKALNELGHPDHSITHVANQVRKIIASSIFPSRMLARSLSVLESRHVNHLLVK